jgi:hypothetical protein
LIAIFVINFIIYTPILFVGSVKKEGEENTLSGLSDNKFIIIYLTTVYTWSNTVLLALFFTFNLILIRKFKNHMENRSSMIVVMNRNPEANQPDKKFKTVERIRFLPLNGSTMRKNRLEKLVFVLSSIIIYSRVVQVLTLIVCVLEIYNPMSDFYKNLKPFLMFYSNLNSCISYSINFFIYLCFNRNFFVCFKQLSCFGKKSKMIVNV